MSLPPSNEKASACASHPILGNGCPVAFRVYAHRGILAVFRSKMTHEECEFLIVERLADLVTVRVSQEPIIAVQGRQHTVKKRSRGLPGIFESNVLGKPQPPVVIHMWNAAESGPGSQDVVEIRQTASQRFHSLGAFVTVIRVEDISNKANALIVALKSRFCGVEPHTKSVGQECFDIRFMLGERFSGICQKHNIIHVSDVSRKPQLVFDILVKLIEIDVGKELAGVAADRQAASGCRPIQRFVAGNKLQQGGIAAFSRRRVRRVMGKNCLDSRPESRATSVAHGAPCQITLENDLQYRLVDAWKKGIDINLTVPNMIRLAQQRLEFSAGCECTPLRTIDIVVIDKAFVPPGFELAHNPVMANPVGKGRCEYLSGFWIGNDKHCVAPRRIGFGRQSLRQRNDDLGQIDQRTICTHSLVDISRTSKKLGDNILKIAI